MSLTQLHRRNKQLTGKALSANTIASFLVCQGIQSVSNLTIEASMNIDALVFLNRETMIDYWQKNGWLTQRNGYFYLTQDGLTECQLREAGESLDKNGKKKAVNVSPQLVAEARRFILQGAPEKENILVDEFDLGLRRA